MEKTRGKLQPTLIVGVGTWGARIASAFARRLCCRTGGVPVVRAAVLAPEDVEPAPGVVHLSNGHPTEDSAIDRLRHELETTRKLAVVRAARRAGWDVDARTPTEVTLVAALNDDSAAERAIQTARSLRELSEGSAVRCPTLSALFLLCPEMDSSDETEADVRLGPWAADRTLFDGGCYLLGRTNADGLLLFDGQDEQSQERQADLIACWLVLCALTDLGGALARAPLIEADGLGTFGLALWEFPAHALKVHLARRWQTQVLDQLLSAPQDDALTSIPFLEQHLQRRRPWTEESNVRFRVMGEAWSTPALRLISRLRQSIDEAVASEWERLQDLIAQAEKRIEPIDDEIGKALAAEIDARLDESGLGATQQFLDALAGAVKDRMAQSEGEVEKRFERLEAMDELVEQAAQTLDKYTGRFPPFRLRVLLGLIARPWRLVRLWLLYREIGHRVDIYLSYCQSLWMLQLEAFEHQWRAALYAGLAQAIREEQEDVAALCAELRDLRDRQAPTSDQEESVVRGLEDVALPASLIQQLYRRTVGQEGPDARYLLALQGPLSSWVREGFPAEALGANILDYAEELFSFVDEMHLDDLLAHTHKGADLRHHLSSLTEAAAPWWAWDETRSPSGGRMGTHRMVLVGLPDAERSPLPDLLPRRHVCFSTGDRHQIVAVQVVRGIRDLFGAQEGV